MKVKEALGLGAADGRTVIPVAVWLPVAIVALVLAIAVVQLADLGGLASILVIAVAFGLVIPVSAVVVSVRGGRRTN